MPDTKPTQGKPTSASDKIIWKDRKHHLWFPFSFTKYYVQNGRVYIEKGFLNSTSDQTLLYRITDIKLKRSLGQKMCGTGTIMLISNIDAEPHLLLENIKNPRKVYNMLANLIEEARSQKNVIGKEFYGRGGGYDCEHRPEMPAPPNHYAAEDFPEPDFDNPFDDTYDA